MRYLLWTLAVLMPLSLLAQPAIELPVALERGWVAMQARGLGGYNGQVIELALKNKRSQNLQIEVPAGWTFASEDSAVQDLMVTQPAMMVLAPGGKAHRPLRVVCTQRSNMSPKRGERFKGGSMARKGLQKLARVIARNKHQTGAAQMAVWALADGRPLDELVSRDTAQARAMANVISEETGFPIARISYAESGAPEIISVRTSLEILCKDAIDGAQLALYSREGEILQTYFTDRKLEAGFAQFRLGVNHWEGREAEVFLRLKAGEQILAEKQVFPADSVTPLKRVRARVAVRWDSPEKLEGATVGVYNTAGDLYFWLSQQYDIEAGSHFHHFMIGKHLPEDQSYVVRVMHTDTLVAEGQMALDTNGKIHPKRTVKGTFQFQQKTAAEGLQLGLYDETGALRRVLFNIHHLNPGAKRLPYQFQHWDGKQYTFYLRLTTTSGDVLVEQKVKG